MLRIAIVDDEPIVADEIRNIVISFFREQGKTIDISCFSSGDEIISSHQKYDLVFLDIQMPGINGIETADMLKKKYSKLNIVFVTGHLEYAFDAYRVHPSGFLSKPVDEDAIRRELEDLRYPMIEEPTVTVQCSPFAIFVGGEPFDFISVQTKELFAYLVYKNGAICSNEELIDVFFGGEMSKKGRLRQLIMDMRNSIEKYSNYEIFVKKYGRVGIDPNAVKIVGKPETLRKFFKWDS